FTGDNDGIDICVSHIAIHPVIRWRFRSRIVLSSAGIATATQILPGLRDTPAVAAAHRVVESLLASIGAVELDRHAAVFKAFEELSRFVDLEALAGRRLCRAPPPWPQRRKILVIKLSALGDFVQALGPAAAIRRRHPLHTIDKQAEQLLMAGIYPTPLPACRASSRPLPAGLDQRTFFLLIPGSSLRHAEKRWPAKYYGMLAQHLVEATGALPVVIG